MTTSKFIVIDHDAKKAKKHQDLRFRIPNSNNWASFAIRKGVPLKSGERVLAIRTHDHSEKEALFVGKIESGYGAGTLKKFDIGSCEIEQYTNAHIVIDFFGKKIKGRYHFINVAVTRRKTADYKEQHYMLFKSKEEK